MNARATAEPCYGCTIKFRYSSWCSFLGIVKSSEWLEEKHFEIFIFISFF